MDARVKPAHDSEGELHGAGTELVRDLDIF
jgi:hypothetical protein